jgi:carboxymethylenebutenolidase
VAKTIELTASDGHRLSAYVAEPAGKPRGGVVVIQEIFGVTRHIRAVADQYAAAGFSSVAPAFFDRVERNVEVPYTDVARGFGYMQKLGNEHVMLDLQAAIENVAAAGNVAVVGYCWGGTMAYLAAARLKIAAAVAYYGGGINGHLAEKPRCPIMFHFGEHDTHIPIAAVEQIRAQLPGSQVFLYPAGHGFNCTDRGSFDAACAKLALDRSLEFLHSHVG